MEPTPDMCTIGELLASGGTVALEAREGGEAAHRRKGWQRAMIRERVARARERGMVYARVSALPLSDSERNFRALGFVPLYTRVTWEWRPSS